jgi:hypothetical protein
VRRIFPWRDGILSRKTNFPSIVLNRQPLNHNQPGFARKRSTSLKSLVSKTAKNGDIFLGSCESSNGKQSIMSSVATGSSFDLESRDLTLGTDNDEMLSVLLKFTRALRQGEIEKDMNALHLYCLEFTTPEISSAIVEMFQQCSSKGVKWDILIIQEYSNPNPYLCSLLSEAQKLGMFQDIDYWDARGYEQSMDENFGYASESEDYFGEDLAVVFRDFMQARNRSLYSLAIRDVSVTNRVASILFHGLKSNATILKLELDNVQLQFEDHMQVVQDAVPEFAEALQHNHSLVELNLLGCQLTDNGLSIIIQSLHDHPTLRKLSLEQSHGRDASLRALGGFLSSPTCALSYLNLSGQTILDSSASLNIAILVQEIEQNNSLERLYLDSNRLSNDDLAVLFGLLPKFPRLPTIDLSSNRISNLTMLAMNDESSRLRTLILDDNPIFQDANDDDRHTMLQLLGAHPELGYLGDGWGSETALYTPEIGHLLDLNRSGRVLLTNANIPLSVWARVFERTNILFKDDPSRQASSIYHFLKEGPVFEFQRS